MERDWLENEIPNCPNCGTLMESYSRPQMPFFVCPECNSDQYGIEVEFCPNCEEPIHCDFEYCNCEEEMEDVDW